MVKGDRTVSYDHILQLMVTLQGAGATSVGLMTDPVEGK
jgi:biopolymer transport protein TolR